MAKKKQITEAGLKVHKHQDEDFEQSPVKINDFRERYKFLDTAD